MKEKKVSIIVPIFNIEKYLKKCIESLINQKYENYEIILIDDGSSDSSRNIIDKYAVKYPKIRALHHLNRGVSYTRNRGIKEATGDYIAFIDGDDWVEPNYLSKMIDYLESNDLDFVVCNYSFYEDNTGKIMDRTMYRCTECVDKIQAAKILLTTSCVPWNKIYKKSIIDKFVFPENIAIGEDSVFLIKLLGKCNRIGFLKESLLFYRQRDGSAMHSGLQAKIWDNIISANIIYDTALAYSCTLRDAAEYRFAENISNIIWQLKYRDDISLIKKKYSAELMEMKNSIRKCYRLFSRNTYIKSRKRLYLNIAYFSPYLLLDLFKVRNFIKFK